MGDQQLQLGQFDQDAGALAGAGLDRLAQVADLGLEHGDARQQVGVGDFRLARRAGAFGLHPHASVSANGQPQ